MTTDLWGDLPEPDTTRPPSQLLYEQAALLGEKTRNILIGVVETVRIPNTERVSFSLKIRAPVLDNYSFDVVQITYPVLHLYPVYVTDSMRGVSTNAADEDSLAQLLGACFGANQTKKTISAILREAQNRMTGEDAT